MPASALKGAAPSNMIKANVNAKSDLKMFLCFIFIAFPPFYFHYWRLVYPAVLLLFL